MTNNAALTHTICTRTHPHPRIAFRVDSKLIAEQLDFRWACRTPMLSAHYEDALQTLSDLRRRPGVEAVVVEHVYREYNADADGVCNSVLDWILPHANAEFVICESWH